MRRLLRAALSLGCAAILVSPVAAQPPRERPRDDGARNQPSLVERLMAFDKNKDGKLTKEEVTDERLQRLFERADANKDGALTKAEIEAVAGQEPGRGPGGPGGRGPGGPGGGPGGRGFGGPPQPGQILAPNLQERLNFTADQKKQLEDLQKDLDGKLAKILTEEQKKQLKDMRDNFGRFGPGGPGGPGFPGGPGGRPPEGGRRPGGEGGRPPAERPPR